MPQIDIKHFVAYATFNNNGDSFLFERAEVPWKPDRQISVEYTVDGCAVFLYRKSRDGFKQQLAYFEELQKLLVAEFGRGFSVAMAPESDCSRPEYIGEFCTLMKKLDPSVSTIVFGSAHGYIPEDERKRRSLKDEWRIEPYWSALLINNEGIQTHQDSVTAKLVDNVDYVTNHFKGVGVGYKVIYEILGTDLETVPHNDTDSEVYVTVNPEQVSKIQKLANQAYYKAAGIEDDLDDDDNLGNYEPASP